MDELAHPLTGRTPRADEPAGVLGMWFGHQSAVGKRANRRLGQRVAATLRWVHRVAGRTFNRSAKAGDTPQHRADPSR